MSQRFTVRVRRGLKEIAAMYRNEILAKYGPTRDKDVLAALAWIDEQGADDSSRAGGMPKEPPAWAKQQFCNHHKD